MAFPNVPRVPGVPPLPRDPLANVPGIIALTRDVLNFFSGFIGPQWGLFSNGIPAIPAESVVSFDFKKNYEVSDYSQEEGAFETYNKVEQPFDLQFRYAAGSPFGRVAMLAAVEAAVDSLELFDAVTPDRVYPSCNVVHYDYTQRANNGVGLLTIDVWVKQVRVSTQTAFSAVKSAGAASMKLGGTVQPIPALPAQFQRFSSFY